MILIDFNQLLISNLLSQVSYDKSLEINEDLVRHMVLSTILFYKKKFGNDYGKLVLCADDRHYWRKKIFPYYKSNRKKSRDSSPLDWNNIFNCLNKIRDEVREYFPYIVIQVESAEADDIIATLCKYSQENDLDNGLFASPKKVVIVSSDKDFLQLQKYENVEQYSPMKKRFITTDNPSQYLLEHIISGDDGDGVPNILSDDDALANVDKRQKALTQKRLEEIHNQCKNGFTDSVLEKNWERNKSVIDLENVPGDIQKEVINSYEKGPKTPNKSKLFGYFSKNKLKVLFNNIDEF